jgi:hypothetical protein
VKKWTFHPNVNESSFLLHPVHNQVNNLYHIWVKMSGILVLLCSWFIWPVGYQSWVSHIYVAWFFLSFMSCGSPFLSLDCRWEIDGGLWCWGNEPKRQVSKGKEVAHRTELGTEEWCEDHEGECSVKALIFLQLSRPAAVLGRKSLHDLTTAVL